MSVYTLASKSSPVAPYSIHFHLFSPSLFFPHYFLLCILYLPFQFIILYYVVAHTLLQISPLLLFFFIWCIHFLQSAMLFVFAICHPVCVSKMILWISLTFFFIHSLVFFLSSRVRVFVSASVHTWLTIFWLSDRCTMTALEEGQ